MIGSIVQFVGVPTLSMAGFSSLLERPMSSPCSAESTPSVPYVYLRQGEGSGKP
jgi:hypothetical protein